MIVLRDSCNKEIQQPLIVISEIVSPVVVIDPPPPLPLSLRASKMVQIRGSNLSQVRSGDRVTTLDEPRFEPEKGETTLDEDQRVTCLCRGLWNNIVVCTHVCLCWYRVHKKACKPLLA